MDLASSTSAQEAASSAVADAAARASATLASQYSSASSAGPLLSRTTPPILEKAALLASTSRNPLALIAEGVLGVLIACFNLATVLITFATLTVPSLVYRILHYSFVLQLNFPSLALLFLAALAAGFVWLRYRHLNRYERLREVPIEKDEGFNLHPDVNVPYLDDDYFYDYDPSARSGRGGRSGSGPRRMGSGGSGGGGRFGVGGGKGERDGGTFHNYLDDFLQAIRIFGFLEKPVFHELARHLQTRRLVAGDSLALDSDFSFYIVIDGNVQVYAPLPGGAVGAAAADRGPAAGAGYGGLAAEEEEDQLSAAGYQLLHEVQSGGTLSSLFTILSLFTEDVRLGYWNEAEGAHTAHSAHHHHNHAQAAAGGLGSHPQSLSGHGHPHAPFDPFSSHESNGAHTPGAASSTGGIPPQLATPPSALRPQQQAQAQALAQAQAQALAQAQHLHPRDDAIGDGASSAAESGDTALPPSAAPSTRVPLSAFDHMVASSQPGAIVQSPAPLHAPSLPMQHLPHDDADVLEMPPAEASAPFSHYLRQQDPGAGAGAGLPAHARARAPAAAPHGSSPAASTPHTPSTPEGARMHRARAAPQPQPLHPHVNGYAPFDARERRHSAGPHAALSSSQHSHSGGGGGSSAAHGMGAGGPIEGPGTVARATTDTTLAVIPAEAFKRLTKKFPNASAHIVQVILTRLSRVTLHTAHKYLGLTKEVMRTEKTINQIACAPLPPSFYESGGMEKLRQRFIKVSSAAPPPPLGASSGLSRANGRVGPGLTRQPSARGHSYDQSEDDYFRFGSKHRDSGSRSASGKQVNLTETPALDELTTDNETETESVSAHRRRVPNAQQVGGHRPKTPWGHPEPPARTPASRTSVGPGDLISTSGLDDRGAWSASGTQTALNTPRPQKSGFSSTAVHRMSSIDEKKPSSADALPLRQPQARQGSFVAERRRSTADEDEIGWAGDGLSNFDLKNSVMTCIANCIGLIPAPNSPVASVQASPFISAQDALLQRSVFNSAFGSLSMLDVMGDGGESSLTGGSNSHVGGFPAELENDVQIRYFEADSVLIQAGEMDVGLFYVIDGYLDVFVPPETQKRDAPPPNGQQVRQDRPSPEQGTGRAAKDIKPIYTVGRGGVAGYLSTLLGTSSYVDVKARTDCYVGFLPAKSLQKMMERRPVVLLTLCKRLLGLLSPLLLHIDSALDWQQVGAGQVIYRQGDEADSFYIVINGRLRAISEKEDGGAGIASNTEFGQGDSVGELDVVTNSLRSMTLHAIRDSELAKMPMSLFNAISIRHPAVTIQMSRIIAGRVRAEVAQKQSITSMSPIPGVPDLGRNNMNLKTVAILPVTRDVPITAFATRLHSAFEDTIGQPAAYLNQQRVMGVLGRHAFNRMGKLKLAGWLADQEEKYRMVMYVVDTAVSSPWAQTSIRQADCILLVGFGDDPSVGEYERLLLGIRTTARKELVLLHPERAVPPGSTRAWLKSRPWVHAHHHVELPGIPSMNSMPAPTALSDQKAVKALKDLRKRIGSRIQQYREKRDIAQPARSHHFSDFARLARRLCGKSIGLILGGGGARGCAHLGMIRALEEKNIPVDIIGGTSIGSFVGGLYAREAGLVPSLGRAKKFSGRMASLWRFAIDLTYPYVSYTTGHEFNRGIFKAFADTHIEDMWLPFFCNTTNITWSKMEIHTTGYAWRYIRGSMTLAGLIPPLVNAGDMLVDGGYMDNLPVSVMFSMGAASVFAVDVGSVDDTSPRSYGDTLSGWWVLLNRWNPWSEAVKIPSIPEIQGRLTYVSSVKTLEEAKAMPGCFYVRMPVEKFGTLEFGKFNEIMAIGYETGRKKLAEWDAAGVIPSGEAAVTSDAVEWRSKRKAGISARRNSV